MWTIWKKPSEPEPELPYMFTLSRGPLPRKEPKVKKTFTKPFQVWTANPGGNSFSFEEFDDIQSAYESVIDSDFYITRATDFTVTVAEVAPTFNAPVVDQPAEPVNPDQAPAE